MSALKARVFKLESVRVDGPNQLAMVLHKARRLHNPALPEVPTVYCNHDYEQLLRSARHGQPS